MEQCNIIRNTELAASQEKLDEIEKRYKEVQANCSPDALLRKLQGTIKIHLRSFLLSNLHLQCLGSI